MRRHQNASAIIKPARYRKTGRITSYAENKIAVSIKTLRLFFYKSKSGLPVDGKPQNYVKALYFLFLFYVFREAVQKNQ